MKNCKKLMINWWILKICAKNQEKPRNLIRTISFSTRINISRSSSMERLVSSSFDSCVRSHSARSDSSFLWRFYKAWVQNEIVSCIHEWRMQKKVARTTNLESGQDQRHLILHQLHIVAAGLHGGTTGRRLFHVDDLTRRISVLLIIQHHIAIKINLKNLQKIPKIIKKKFEFF